ncbi:OmpA family protein [Parvicella tangerina]|uniref:Peptidoglycan-associated lipoprotein n=1 Tax=Parvicella tangerina TaxID=2829795 RepID=A0A916JK00_9FLAO|nr:OmpA family protein [Parvicella tangerina]CAG5077461.1 Peptidoglycan-associated lipoprotein [Parvicella tangerina]
MNRLTQIFTLAFVLINSFSFAQDKSFKELYYEASDLLFEEEYNKALPILLEMEKMDDKNWNTLSSIGYCYLQTTFDKAKAIPYFERVLEDYKRLSIAYQVDNHKEKNAPVETIHWIGKAYHFNYQFDEALEKFNEYKDLLDPDNEEMLAEVKTDIRITRNAIAYKEHPVDVTINDFDVINTEYSEYRPKINGDETEMYFTSRRPHGDNPLLDEDGLYYEDIYYSKKKNGEWTKPVRVEGAINSDSHDACLYLSPDGLNMIIYRTHIENNNEGGIYQSQLIDGKWSEPKLMIAEVNSSYWETDANISADGNTLFYTSDKPGGQGGRDIWQMKKLPTGEWAKVQNLGYPVNSDIDEEAPYLHPDGKTLYFSSKSHSTMGGFDVYSSTLNNDGTWTEPKNLGYPINTTGDDVFYFPTNDGKRAYFSSYREGGKGKQDIYMIEIPSYDLKTLAVYKGLAKYTTGEVIKELQIDITKTSNEEHGTYRPNNLNGKFLFILQPGETFFVDYKLQEMTLRDTIVVPNEGGVYDILKIVTVIDDQLVLQDAEIVDGELVAIEAENMTDLTENEVTETLNSGKPIVLNDLYFIYDKDRLISDSKPDLSKLIKYMKDNPDVKIVLEGHTDFKGAEDYNQNLSEKRSARVKKKLIEAGVSSSRIATKGYGESKPIANNTNPDGSDNPEGRQKNRRVEVKIQK